MQSVPGFPSDLTVTKPSGKVTVGGKTVDFEQVTVSSELESAMPSQIAVAGGAVVAATGDVDILPQPDLVFSPANPWGNEVPTQGTDVTVSAGYEGAEALQFTGVVDGASGAPRDQTTRVRLIDGVDRLDRPITIPPMLNVWPNLTEGDYTWRRAGLSPIYFTDRILRHCGFYATPRLSGVPVMSAPMLGSSWPERGTLSAAAAHSDPTLSTAWSPTHWGVALANGIASYMPDYGSRTGKLDGEFQMTFVRSLNPTNSGVSATFTVYWGTAGLRIQSASSGHVYARHINTNGTETNVATLLAADAQGADTFTVRWIPGGNVTIYASNGANVTATRTYPTPITDTAMTRVEVVSPPSSIPWGGFQAAFSVDPSWLFERTAHLTPPALIYGVPAFPALIDRNCAELLKEQAEAELAAMWLDEKGHFRWVNRNVLAGSNPVGTLTSQANLLDLPWEIPTKSVYSRVELSADQLSVTRRAWSNLTLWEGSAESMNDQDENEQFIEPEADEWWVMVSTPVRAAVSAAQVKSGRGSIMGGILTADGAADAWASSTELVQTWSAVNPQRWRLSSKANISSAQQVETQILEGSMYGKYSGDSLPRIRGRARIRAEEKIFIGAVTGPSNAPVLSHKVGPWIQDNVEIQELADWLASQVTITTPIIRDVPIVPDTRIQKGDVLWLDDADVYGVRLKVLVMGITVSITAGPPVELSQSITCRVIESSRLSVTLDEHDSVWAGKTLDQHDAFWSGKTLDQHDADPLAH